MTRDMIVFLPAIIRDDDECIYIHIYLSIYLLGP